MCGSRKYLYPSKGGLLKKSKGRRRLKNQHFVKESMNQNLNFQQFGEGGRWVGIKLKNLPWEGYGYFLKQHNVWYVQNMGYLSFILN